MHRTRRYRSLLHYALLLVVALGVMLQPVLGAMGDLHDVEHTVATQSDHGHAHHDGHDDPVGEKDPSGDPVGAHNLVHKAGFATSMVILDSTERFLFVVSDRDPPACFTSVGPPIAPLTLPFRPPIV